MALKTSTPSTPSWTSSQLLSAANSLFADIESASPSIVLLSHFSTTETVFFEHAPRNSYPSSLLGLNAVRSYFDLLATNWTCLGMLRHSTDVSLEVQQVVVKASVMWRWKKSRNSWREDFTCTLDYDDHLKIKSFVIKTDSGPETCLMRAKDRA